MRHNTSKTASALTLGLAVMISLPLGAGSSHLVSAQASINDRSLTLSDSRAGVSATYRIRMTAPAKPLVGSIKIEFCENSPLFGEPCNAPAGFDLSGATIASQSGEVGFSRHPTSTANVLVLRRPPVSSVSVESTYVLADVMNATNAGSQYARYSTYAEEDASGTILDSGGIAYYLNERLGITTEVPPILDFCVGVSITGTVCATATGNYVQLGELSTSTPRVGKTEMVVGTNAANGYNISINGRTLFSGTNGIPSLSSPTASSPGTSQFGVNLRANSVPASGADPSGPGTGSPSADYNIANRFTFREGDVIAGHTGPERLRKYTLTYMTNISREQPTGVYSATYTYVALGNF